MKEELVFEGITDIREDIIEKAETYVFSMEAENGKNRKNGFMKCLKTNPVWVTVTVAAACLLLVFVSPFVYMATRKCGSSAPPGAEAPHSSQPGSTKPGDTVPEGGVVATNNVWIYYVEDGEICREQHYVKLQAADVFEIWREKNGIGAEVQLLDCEIRSSATTEQVGEAVKHTLGDYHAFYLTVSKNLKDYYGQMDENLLLESLEQTMTGYSGLEYQEYHLILE